MARKKDTPQKAALREMMGNYLKENNVTCLLYTSEAALHGRREEADMIQKASV